MKVIIYSLKELKIKKNYLYGKTINWIKSMKIEKDGEDGIRFLKWIKTNLQRKIPFCTYIAIVNNNPVGTVSIIPDDQTVGKKNKIHGIWIGGWNVKKSHRKKGIGKKLISHVYEKLKKYSKNKKKIQINFFTNNSITIEKVAKKYGFSQVKGIKIKHHGKDNFIYTKLLKNLNKR